MTDANEDISDGNQSSSSQTEWDVKEILDERRNNGKRQYLVEWLDLQSNGEKWPDSWVDTCSSELIARWEKTKALKRKQSRTHSGTPSSSRTPREPPRRTTRSSFHDAIASAEDQRSESPPIRLTRSTKSSPRKRLAVQAFSSDEQSEASLSLQRSSVKRRRIRRASRGLQGSPSMRERSKSNRPKDDDSYEDSAGVSAIPDIPAGQRLKKKIPTDDESYVDNGRLSTSTDTRHTSRSILVVSDDEVEAEETSNSITDHHTPEPSSRKRSKRSTDAREISSKLVMDSDSDGAELEAAEVIIEPFMSPAYREKRKTRFTPIGRSTSAVVTSDKSGPPAPRSGDRNFQRKFKIVAANQATSSPASPLKQRVGESKGHRDMHPDATPRDSLGKTSSRSSQAVTASGLPRRGNSRPDLEISDSIEPPSSADLRGTAPEDISAFTSTAPSGSAPLEATGIEDISTITSTSQSHSGPRTTLGPIPRVSPALFRSYRAETPTSPIDQYTPSPAVRPTNSASSSNVPGSSQSMNPIDHVQSGEIRTDSVPGDDSERIDSQRSEFDKAFIVDTQESVRPTSDLSYGGLLDGLQDHSGPSQDHGLSAPEHLEPPLVDVVSSSISDPALSVPMSNEPMSDINRPLSRQLAENTELLQERNREIDRLRGQLASVNPPGGFSVLLGVKTKLIQSLRAEVTFHIGEIRKLRQDQEQNARDLAVKLQHLAQMDRHREESERLQISNRHLVGTQAELKAQIDHLKADKAAMTAKIASTEKLVTELSESLTAYANREAQTLGSSEQVPGATPVSTEVTGTQERGNIAAISALTVQLRDVEAKLRDGPSASSPVDVQADTTNEAQIVPTMDVALKDLQDCIESLNRRIRDHISNSDAREASLVQGLDANKTSLDARVSTLEQEKEGLRQEIEKLKKEAADEAIFVGFMQTRYEEETTKASTHLKENVRLRAENEVVRSQVEEGVKQVRVFYQTAEEKLREELDQAHGEIRILLEKERRVGSRSADGMTQDYAALEKDLKELAVDAVSWKRHVSLLAAPDVEINGVDAESSDEDSRLPSRTLAHILERFKGLKASAEEFRDKYNAFKKFEGSVPWEDSISRLVDIGFNIDLEKEVLSSVVNEVVERFQDSEPRYGRVKDRAESFHTEPQLQGDVAVGVEPETESRPALALSPSPAPASSAAEMPASSEIAALAPDVGDGMYTWNMDNAMLRTGRPTSPFSLSNSSRLLSPASLPEGNSHRDSLKNEGDETNAGVPVEERVYPCPSWEASKPCVKDFPSITALKAHILDAHLAPKTYPTD